jgi:hypothetical protein
MRLEPSVIAASVAVASVLLLVLLGVLALAAFLSTIR